MIFLILTFIYGIGFGLVFMGGLMYAMLLGFDKRKVSLWKFILWVVFWPITVAYLLAETLSNK